MSNMLQFLFVNSPPPICPPSIHAAFSTRGERACCGAGGEQRGPSVCCFILCLLRNSEAVFSSRAQRKWNVHMCVCVCLSSTAAVCPLYYCQPQFCTFQWGRRCAATWRKYSFNLPLISIITHPFLFFVIVSFDFPCLIFLF